MSRIIICEAKARRDYRCARYRHETCIGGGIGGGWISAGAVYQRESLPPHTEHNETDAWSTYRTCLACRDADREDGFRWVRNHYGVPVSMDLPVRFDGRDGRIVGATGGHLLLAMADGTKAQVHPKWRMEYPVTSGATP